MAFAKNRGNVTASGGAANARLGAWRGFSPGEYGVNLSFGVANVPNTGLGQSYVLNMPTPSFPPNRALGGQPLGAGTSGVPGRPVSRAVGNPDVSTVPQNQPMSPYGGNSGDTVPQFGRSRVLGVGQESSWRGGANFSNDKLMTMDRHGFLKRGNELSGRDSGQTDPPMQGPARPSLVLVNRTINYQQGTDTTRDQDDLNRPYARTPDGKYFMGTQGDAWTPVYGGTPGLYQPYGTYQGIGNVPLQGIQSPVIQGAPGDGPQSFKPGPPHGLHSPTLPDYMQTLGYYMAVPQMRLPRIDRPSNSTIGGQSYSQTVQPQGQTGTAAQQASGNNLANASAGVNWQMRKRMGWRGQAGAGNGNQ
jgi:hypothetical protein